MSKQAVRSLAVLGVWHSSWAAGASCTWYNFPNHAPSGSGGPRRRMPAFVWPSAVLPTPSRTVQPCGRPAETGPPNPGCEHDRPDHAAPNPPDLPRTHVWLEHLRITGRTVMWGRQFRRAGLFHLRQRLLPDAHPKVCAAGLGAGLADRLSGWPAAATLIMGA